MQGGQLLTRRLERVVLERMADEPVVVLSGPRTVGKSTLLRSVGRATGAEVTDLDDVAVRTAVAADPALFASGPAPVLLDEFQHVPAVLDAIKAELNRDLRPGRFVLTGSTSYGSLPRTAQSLTGRVHVIEVRPLSQGEIDGGAEAFLELLFDDVTALASPQPSRTTREQYASRVVAGGMPLALARTSEQARRRWTRDYVALVLERDAALIRGLRDRLLLPAFLARVASQTAQVLNVAKASSAVGVHHSTGGEYLSLLEAVFLVHRLPGWGRTLASRAAVSPKVHVVDSGVAAHLLDLGTDRLASRDPAALTEFGHLLETFVVGEVLKQRAWSDRGLTVSHFRTHDRYEVDLIIERDDGRVAAVEVKAGSSIADRDLSGLRFLRDQLGDRFVAGLALSTGTRSYRVEDRIVVAPVDRLWTPSSREATG